MTTSDSTPPRQIGRLREIVAAYGADPRRWPETERAAAFALAGESVEARAQVGEEAALDDRLAALVAPAPSDVLVARLKKLNPAAQVARPEARRRRGPLPAAAAIAIAAAASLVTIWALPGGGDAVSTVAITTTISSGEILPGELALIDTNAATPATNATADDAVAGENGGAEIELAGLPVE